MPKDCILVLATISPGPRDLLAWPSRLALGPCDHSGLYDCIPLPGLLAWPSLPSFHAWLSWSPMAISGPFSNLDRPLLRILLLPLEIIFFSWLINTRIVFSTEGVLKMTGFVGYLHQVICGFFSRNKWLTNTSYFCLYLRTSYRSVRTSYTDFLEVLTDL